MALTSITKDFITKGGVIVQAAGVVTSSTGQVAALQVNSGAAISQNIVVGTTASIYGITNLYGGALANAPVTVASTLTVTGPTFLASTTATLFSATSIVVAGNEIIGGSINVIGSSVFGIVTATALTATSITVNGNETITGGLSVGGSTVLAGVTATVFTATSVTVNGNETITGGLSVNGAAVFTIVTATVFTATSLTVNGASTLKGITSITDQTNATSTNSGALQVIGGAGIGRDLWVGGAAYIAGDLYVDGTQFVVNKTSIGTGDLVFALATGTTSAALAATAGLYIGSTVTSAAYISWTFDGASNWVSSNGVKVNSTLTNNGTAASGALQVVGGVGIGGGLTVTGTITATNHVGTIGSALSTIGAGTNLYGGTAGALVYQSAPSVTAFLNSGTNGQLLYMSGGQPTWVAPTGLSAGSATTASNIAGGLKDQIPYQSAVGQTTFGTGLTFNGTTFTTTNAVISGGTNATTTNSGSLQVVGGVGISRDLWVGGDINLSGSLYLKGVGLDQITSTTGTFVNLNVTGTNYSLTIPNGGISVSTTVTAASAVFSATSFSTTTTAGNALQVVGGGLGTSYLYVDQVAKFNGNLFVNGIISGTSVTQLFANNGTFYGVPYGFGALYAGITGYTPLPQTVLQLTANSSTYVQTNFQNINASAQATTDWVATAGDGYDAGNYIDMGITNGTWDGAQPNSLGTALKGSDGYVYVQGSLPGRGNLVLGATSTSTQIKFVVGGAAATWTAVTIASPNVAAQSTTTGTVIVYGGIAATSAYIGGIVTSTQLILTSAIPAGSAGVGALQVAGGASIGAGLYVTGPTTSTGAIQMGSGATGLILTSNGTNGAVYTTNVTPSATNYGFATSGATSYVNGTTNVQFATNGVTTATIQGGLGSTSTYGGQTFIVAANGIGVTGNSYFANGVGFGGTVYANGLLSATSGVANTGTVNSGALQVVGGVGVTGGATFGGIVTATTFVGNLTGNVTGNLTGTASLATTSTNLALGAAGSIPIQVSPGVTGFIPLGTSGYVLTAGATTATWAALSGVTAGNATTATNIAGGAQYQIPFQSATGLTTFSSNFTYNNTVNQFSATNIIVSGITTASGQLQALAGTATAGTNTGALIVYGGAGVSGSMNVGGSISAGVANTATGTPNITFIGGNTTLASYTSGVISGTATVNLDSWSTSTYRTARYLVQIVDSGKVHVQEMTLFLDNAYQIYLNQYGISTNQGELGTFDANTTATVGSVTLNFTPSPSATAMTIKLSRQTITI
jgi:hypothetical protein